MENGQVKNPNPVSNHESGTSASNPDHHPAADTESMDGTVEYRIIMAYATRRRPNQEAGPQKGDRAGSVNSSNEANGTAAPQKPVKTEKEEREEKPKKKKKKRTMKGSKRLPFFKCIQPQAEEEEEDDKEPAKAQSNVTNRCIDPKSDSRKDDVENVASRLVGIADEIQFIPPDVESDSGETEIPCTDENVEKVIGLLLRETGDRLNEELKAANIASDLFLNYDFFRNLLSTFLRRIGYRSSSPNDLGPQASPKTQIAVTCEVTCRLSALDTLTSSSLLQHGARYLQQNYSNWAQNQGGYDAAIESDEETD